MNTKITKQLFLAMAALVLTACSEFLPEQKYSCSKGRSSTVLLNIGTVPLLEQGEVPDTRAIEPGSVTEGTEPDQVNDFWLLEYGNDGKLLTDKGKPVVKYIKMAELTSQGYKLDIQLPAEGENPFTCVMIANTHDESFFDSKDISEYNTIEGLKSFTKVITSFENTYNANTATEAKKGDLYLSCDTKVSSTSTKLVCNFSRNVAKLTLLLENKAESGMEITGIQICNVPSKMAYANCLYKESTDTMAYGARIINMPEENIQLKSGEKKTCIYYLPRNCRGKDFSILDTKSKNSSKMADSATCVKIFAKNQQREVPYCYTFYIGADMKNDFNVNPNNHYILPVNIYKNNNDTTDIRVEDIAPYGANCIMMSLDEDDKDSIYTIYPYRRINKFWSSIFAGEEEDAVIKQKIITDNYKWIAEIIWQDIDGDVIGFGETGKYDKFEGKGKTPLKIKLKENIYSPCNVLIGVRKKGEKIREDGMGYPYLWSWHLWITPYKPNVKRHSSINKGDRRRVPFGFVFHYEQGKSNNPGRGIWFQEYPDKFIMDRNLGAKTEKTPTPEEDLEKSSGLLYQFGRKDPFVATGLLYKQYGNSSDVKLWFGWAKSFGTGVKYPYLFYTRDPKNASWVRVEETRPMLEWENCFPSDKEFRKKSFFDPCPQGWCVPKNTTWDVFQKSRASVGKDAIEDINVKGGKSNFKKGYEFYIAYHPGYTTYYPATGYRDFDGKLAYVGKWGGCWSSTKTLWEEENKIKAFSFEFTGEEKLCTEYYTATAFGLPVRCIQE